MFYRVEWKSAAWSFALVCVGAGVAAAQDLDIVVQSVNGQLVTGTVNIDDDPGSPSATLGVRVHSRSFDLLFALNEPGFNSLGSTTSNLPPEANALPGGAGLTWDFLPMTVGGVTSNLLYWNGAGENAKFGAAPGAEYSLSLIDINAQPFAADGSAKLIPGGLIGTTAVDGFLHSHRYFFLDNDLDGGNSTVAAPGVYLASMRLRMAGLDRSAPFYVLFGTPEVSEAMLGVADAWVEDRVDSLAPDFSADVDGDLDVDGADVLTWQRGVGLASGALQIQGDANHDHAVNAVDLALLASQFGSSLATFGGASTSATMTVPEPVAAVITLLGTVGLFGIARSRRHEFHWRRP